MNVTELRSLLDKVKQVESFPCKKTNVEALTDLEATFNVSKLPIVSVEVKGHVGDEKAFTAAVVDRAKSLPEIRNWRGAPLRLVLDLRKVFLVSESTVFRIMETHCGWLGANVGRICVVMPKSERNRVALYKGNQAFSSCSDDYDRPSMPPTRIVHRARDVREYIEPRKVPRPPHRWPKYSPTGYQ